MLLLSSASQRRQRPTRKSRQAQLTHSIAILGLFVPLSLAEEALPAILLGTHGPTGPPTSEPLAALNQLIEEDLPDDAPDPGDPKGPKLGSAPLKLRHAPGCTSTW